MRAVDALSRDLLAEFHPLAAAAVLLPREEFAVLLEMGLRDALHPLPVLRDVPDERTMAAAEDWRARSVRALEAFARAQGVHGTPWREVPRRSDPDHVVFCPRCSQQFTRAAPGCDRCLELPLESLGPP
jgi:hypothetical protein